VDIVEGLIARLASVRLGWRDLVATVGAGIGNWAFDCGCLAFSFVAVGSPVPWRGLLLAYGAGQLAQNLPITPGGLGVVENSLTIALVAFGGSQTSTVAAVLVYRIITFWGYLPVGWLDWAGLRLTQRRQDRLLALAAVHAAETLAAAEPPSPAHETVGEAS
ncbi:MAG TPA: YbhN family protein, partial [Acidimicrobiales bacterium]|nr:YbhN family protein [Acidimicrobiales bacterium]